MSTQIDVVEELIHLPLEIRHKIFKVVLGDGTKSRGTLLRMRLVCTAFRDTVDSLWITGRYDCPLIACLPYCIPKMDDQWTVSNKHSPEQYESIQRWRAIPFAYSKPDPFGWSLHVLPPPGVTCLDLQWFSVERLSHFLKHQLARQITMVCVTGYTLPEVVKLLRTFPHLDKIVVYGWNDDAVIITKPTIAKLLTTLKDVLYVMDSRRCSFVIEIETCFAQNVLNNAPLQLKKLRLEPPPLGPLLEPPPLDLNLIQLILNRFNMEELAFPITTFSLGDLKFPSRLREITLYLPSPPATPPAVQCLTINAPHLTSLILSSGRQYTKQPIYHGCTIEIRGDLACLRQLSIEDVFNVPRYFIKAVPKLVIFKKIDKIVRWQKSVCLHVACAHFNLKEIRNGIKTLKRAGLHDLCTNMNSLFPKLCRYE